MSDMLRERKGNTEILTINRPEARNAVNGSVSRAFAAAFDELENDEGCAVVIVTGAGDKAFSAGMDLKAFTRGEADHRRGERFGTRGGLRDGALLRPGGGGGTRHLRDPRGQARPDGRGRRIAPAPEAPAD